MLYNYLLRRFRSTPDPEVEMTRNKWICFSASLYAISVLFAYFKARVYPQIEIKPLGLSLAAVFAVLALICVYRQSGTRIRAWISEPWLWVFSVLLAGASVVGAFLEAGLPVAAWGARGLLVCVSAVPGAACLVRGLLICAFEAAGKLRLGRRRPSSRKDVPALIWLKSFLLILAAWFPVFLAYYPGLWNYDVVQVLQVMDGVYNTHHPLLHTLFVGSLYRFGVLRDDPNLGLLLHSVIQCTLMAAIFAWARVTVTDRESRRTLGLLTLLFFAFYPVHPILALSTTKDVLFSGLFLFCVILMKRYLDQVRAGEKPGAGQICLLFAALVLMILFRNNALYAVVLCACVCLVLSVKKHVRPAAALFLCLGLLTAVACSALLTRALNASSGNIREMLPVPCQQQARIYSELSLMEEEGVPLREEDREAMAQIAAFDIAWEYSAFSADPPKNKLNIQSREELLRFLKLSARLAAEYPLITADSFLYLTKGYWYLGDISHSEIYGKGFNTGTGYLITAMYTGYGVTRESRFSALEHILNELFNGNRYQQFPILSLLFSPALWVWLQIFCLFVFFSRKRYDYAALSFFTLSYFLTVLLGPCVLVRYVYPLIVTAPVYLSTCIDAADANG